MGSRIGPRPWIAMLFAVGWLGLAPGVAAAHGPVDPVASSYLASVSQVPAGVQAKVVDGDQRMWLRVPPRQTVIVLDYRGGAYLRFSPSGVSVNQSSAMYYLNQVPSEPPPPGLSVNTPPRWQAVSAGHDYGWHDGRLHALAVTAHAPGVSYLGRWRIPLTVGGRAVAISGGLRYARDPSIVWFWPVLVALICALAAVRIRRPELHVRIARPLAGTVLLAVAAGEFGRELHGRPDVSAYGIVVLVLVLAVVAWWLGLLAARRGSWLLLFAVAFAGLWQGLTLLPAIAQGYVLLALPASLARVVTVVCLAGGVALLALVVRISMDLASSREGSDEPEDEFDWDEDFAWDR